MRLTWVTVAPAPVQSVQQFGFMMYSRGGKAFVLKGHSWFQNSQNYYQKKVFQRRGLPFSKRPYFFSIFLKTVNITCECENQRQNVWLTSDLSPYRLKLTCYLRWVFDKWLTPCKSNLMSLILVFSGMVSSLSSQRLIFHMSYSSCKTVKLYWLF